MLKLAKGPSVANTDDGFVVIVIIISSNVIATGAITQQLFTIHRCIDFAVYIEAHNGSEYVIQNYIVILLNTL
jgi:hypothetical protein